MTKREIKRLLILSIPYVVFGLVSTNLGEAWRMAKVSGHYADWGMTHYFSPLWQGDYFMAFFNSAITVLQTLVVALGAGLGIWGAINLLEGYGNDNPGAKSQGMKQLMAGGGVALIGTTLVPLLSGLFG